MPGFGRVPTLDGGSSRRQSRGGPQCDYQQTKTGSCGLRNAVQWMMRSQSRRKSLRSEEHTSELQSHLNLVCRLLLEKKKNGMQRYASYLNYARESMAEVSLTALLQLDYECR